MIEVKKIPTGKGALILVALAAIVIAIAAYLIMNPDVLKNILVAIAVIAVAILIIVLIAYVVIAIIAIPAYALKGEQVQTGASYNVDDVKGVGGEQKSVEAEEKKEDSQPGTKQ